MFVGSICARVLRTARPSRRGRTAAMPQPGSTAPRACRPSCLRPDRSARCRRARRTRLPVGPTVRARNMTHERTKGAQGSSTARHVRRRRALCASSTCAPASRAASRSWATVAARCATRPLETSRSMLCASAAAAISLRTFPEEPADRRKVVERRAVRHGRRRRHRPVLLDRAQVGERRRRGGALPESARAVVRETWHATCKTARGAQHGTCPTVNSLMFG